MHEHWDELLVFYAENQLDGEERAAFEQHLEDCGACCIALQEWREIAQAVRIVSQKEAYSLPPLAILGRKSSSILEYPQQKAATHPGGTSSSRRTILHMLLLAAALSILLMGGFNLYRINSAQQTYQPIASTQAVPGTTVYDLIVHDSRFTLFARAVERYPEIQAILQGTNPITVFVPTDNVMLSFLHQQNSPSIDDISDYQLQGIVIGHMVNGSQTMETLAATGFARGTLTYVGYRYNTGFRVEENDSGQFLIINHWVPQLTNVLIVEPNIMASNGVIHVIDSVLLPQDFYLRVIHPTQQENCIQMPCPISPL